MLLEGDVAASVIGNDEALGESGDGGRGHRRQGRVWRDAHLINGVPGVDEFPGLQPKAQEVRSAMSAPLIHREELLGVLNVNADIAREFNVYDLRALSLFAEQASSAITNARLFEAERSHVAELLELDLLKTEFVTREPRAPDAATSILAAAQAAQRPERLAEHPRSSASSSAGSSTLHDGGGVAHRVQARRGRQASGPQEVDLAGSRVRSPWIYEGRRANDRRGARRAGRGPRRRGLDAPRAGQPDRQRDEVRGLTDHRSGRAAWPRRSSRSSTAGRRAAG